MEAELRQVVFTHPNGARALDGVDLVVPQGQFCILLGPSGAGKSTLLDCLSGLCRPQSGAVRLDGKLLDSSSAQRLRRHIGIVPQHHALVARASVAGNVIAGAATEMPWWRAVSGFYSTRWRAAAVEAAKAVGLDPAHLAGRASALSGGQQQRVAIARALIRRPRLLLVDEPVASLDPATAEDVLELIRSQARIAGTTVICSLHQVELARRFADRIVALRSGRVVGDTRVAEFCDASRRDLYRPRIVAEAIP